MSAGGAAPKDSKGKSVGSSGSRGRDGNRGPKGSNGRSGHSASSGKSGRPAASGRVGSVSWHILAMDGRVLENAPERYHATTCSYFFIDGTLVDLSSCSRFLCFILAGLFHKSRC